MALEFTEDSGRKLRALKVELARVLRRANDQKLEAAIAAFACVQLTRELLDKYPDATRLMLLEQIERFLHHETAPEKSSLLMMS